MTEERAKGADLVHGDPRAEAKPGPMRSAPIRGPMRSAPI
jgi:hypothetical protein